MAMQVREHLVDDVLDGRDDLEQESWMQCGERPWRRPIAPTVTTAPMPRTSQPVSSFPMTSRMANPTIMIMTKAALIET